MSDALTYEEAKAAAQTVAEAGDVAFAAIEDADVRVVTLNRTADDKWVAEIRVRCELGAVRRP